MVNRTTLSGLNLQDFSAVIDGKEVGLYVLTNANGMEVTAINYGAKIVSVFVPDCAGQMRDVVLGKTNIIDYQNNEEPYFGAICGRTANRIAGGRFSLNGKEYQLAVNNGPNSLHGGIKGFNAVVWDAKQIDAQTLELRYVSPNGEEGYPGRMEVKVVYRLNDENGLEIEYEATSDADTIVNLTNHSYFNLSGEGDPYVGDHLLQINASSYLPTSEVAIPLGTAESVSGTPFDFRETTAIGARIDEDDRQLVWGNGYDHTFVLEDNGEKMLFCAMVESPQSGIKLEVYTSEPGVQLYTGNYLDGSFVGKKGHRYPKRSAFCLETQHFPDSINHPDFPSVILKRDETYCSKTIFKFSV